VTETSDGARYAIGGDEESAAREQERLRALARLLDPQSIEAIGACGITSGWHCLEVGAGAGSLAAWMAERVGADGRVMSLDIDLRFHEDMPDNVIVRQADIISDKIPTEHFDLVHARAVLQHLGDEREAVLDKLVVATKPGGWLVLEDAEMRAFAEQPLPEPLATVHGALHQGAAAFQPWWDPNLGTRLPALCRQRGLEVHDAYGRAWAMRGGEDSGEWWFAALEHTAPQLVAAGVVEESQVHEALAQARTDGFVMMGPVAMTVRARRSLAATI
jgi:SAM-dependent methyltransferase